VIGAERVVSVGGTLFKLLLVKRFYFDYRELRIACTVAQLEREGGLSPRISPLAQVCPLTVL
jgi:hypothetical protein